MARQLTVAVTGLNATDNPGPGVAVIRSLRLAKGLDLRIVGLVYDALEPGIYARDLVDDVFMIPYPSAGAEATLERLRQIHSRAPLDVIMPTLDAELPGFISNGPALAALGIGTFLPTESQYDLRGKSRLFALGERAGIEVPAAITLSDPAELYQAHQRLRFPVYVKGLYYGAELAYGVDEAVHAFHRIVAQWGLPVIVQSAVRGDELNVVALGDGKGGLVGALAMKKTFITDKGKGWAGIVIRNPALIELTEAFMRETRWRGPCELELIKSAESRYYLLEINPRFPAWVYLSAGAGLNLPLAAMQLARGVEPDPLGDYTVGTLFVRIAIDQIATLDEFQALATTGELHRAEHYHESPTTSGL